MHCQLHSSEVGKIFSYVSLITSDRKETRV